MWNHTNFLGVGVQFSCCLLNFLLSVPLYQLRILYKIIFPSSGILHLYYIPLHCLTKIFCYSLLCHYVLSTYLQLAFPSKSNNLPSLYCHFFHLISVLSPYQHEVCNKLEILWYTMLHYCGIFLHFVYRQRWIKICRTEGPKSMQDGTMSCGPRCILLFQ